MNDDRANLVAITVEYKCNLCDFDGEEELSEHDFCIESDEIGFSVYCCILCGGCGNNLWMTVGRHETSDSEW